MGANRSQSRTIEAATTGLPEREGAHPPEPHDANVPVGADAPIMPLMATTRALRRLSPEPVPAELIRSIIEAATWAPTGSNAQGIAFVVVTDRATMARLARLWGRAVDDFGMLMDAAAPGRPSNPRIRAAVDYQREHLAETPVLVVACYDQRNLAQGARDSLATVAAIARATGPGRTARLLRAFPTFKRRTEAASTYPAVQNLLLAARAHGLAACLTTWHLLAENELKAMLGIPKGVETFAVIPIGWPLDRFGPVTRRPVDDFIHRDRW